MTLKSKDPTLTLTARGRAVSQSNRRFNAIKSVITETIVDNNVLANATADSADGYVFLRDAAKIDRFNEWLLTQIDTEILQPGLDPKDNWLNVFIAFAYERGAETTRDRFRDKLGDNVALIDSDVFATPAHFERSQLVYTRVYNQLKGVSDYMAQDMSRVLANGILRGEGTKAIARQLNDRVEKIGKTRARLIARTEIVNAHNIASIQEAEDAERLLGEEVRMKWSTALDGRERETHRARHNKVYTRKEVAALIGEPNCRCSVSPFLVDF